MMPHRRSGFTLLEIMIAIAILASVFLVTYLIIFQSSSQFTHQTRMANIQENARRVLDDLVNEIRMADAESIDAVPPLAPCLPADWPQDAAKDSVTFQVPSGFTTDTEAVSVTWSTPITYRIEASPVDADNYSGTQEYRLVREGPEAPTYVTSTVRRLCDYVYVPPPPPPVFRDAAFAIALEESRVGGILISRNLRIRLTMVIANDMKYDPAQPQAHIFKTYVESSVKLRNRN